MYGNSLQKPLLVIVGPTAVGKTTTAIELALRLDGEVVSADSRYFYRGMDIGTAKPTMEERQGVPHHLVDVADPDERWSLSIFQRAAKDAIHAIHGRGRLPILVGGTGQFVKAVVEDWVPPDIEPNLRMREVLEAWGREISPAELHRKLSLLDPEAAAHMDANNLRRSVRALEVIFSTGRRFSSQQVKNISPYQVVQIGLTRPREEIYARVDQRIDWMMTAGLLDEVQRLLARGFSPDLPSMSAIGYREAGKVLRGEMTREEAVMWMKRLTRVFVRKQYNWFRLTDPGIQWFEVQGLDLDVLAARIRQQFSGS